MSRIDSLEAAADRRRAAFAASLKKLKGKLTPLGLADEGLRRLDPQRQAVNGLGQSLKENPLPLAPLLLGFSWLALNLRKPVRASAKKPAKVRPRARRKSLTQSQKEGKT